MRNLLQREFTNIMFKPETYEIILLFDDQNDASFSELFIGSKISLVYDKSMVRKNKPGISS